jgi:hypothetical protein
MLKKKTQNDKYLRGRRGTPHHSQTSSCVARRPRPGVGGPMGEVEVESEDHVTRLGGASRRRAVWLWGAMSSGRADGAAGTVRRTGYVPA